VKGLEYVFILKDSATKKSETVYFSYPHPYYDELINLEIKPEVLTMVKKQLYSPIETTTCHWIWTVTLLKEMIEKLKTEKELSVDLEHHSYRSFLGSFTCLLQISSRTEDYLIDAIELRPHLYLLNDIFADPNIIKVFHAANNDILWLQYDFGVYVVNMFDTYQAASVLEYTQFSLNYLVTKYCGIGLDKAYQVADWRLRPLPEEMMHYAQGDTHYLLYIYDCMRNEAYEKGDERQNLLRSVWTRSRDICLLTFEKPVITETTYDDFLQKNDVTLDPTQKAVFINLFDWRDKMARDEDESIRFVLPNHMLVHIAMDMPTNVISLFDICKPLPPLVKLNAHELVQMIQTILEKTKSGLSKENPINLSQSILSEPILTPPAPIITYSDSFLDKITDEIYTPKLKVKAIPSKINADFLANKPCPFSLHFDN